MARGTVKFITPVRCHIKEQAWVCVTNAGWTKTSFWNVDKTISEAIKIKLFAVVNVLSDSFRAFRGLILVSGLGVRKNWFGAWVLNLGGVKDSQGGSSTAAGYCLNALLLSFVNSVSFHAIIKTKWTKQNLGANWNVKRFAGCVVFNKASK